MPVIVAQHQDSKHTYRGPCSRLHEPLAQVFAVGTCTKVLQQSGLARVPNSYLQTDTLWGWPNHPRVWMRGGALWAYDSSY